jgi:DNA-binding beta-propeller fold protein YncE
MRDYPLIWNRRTSHSARPMALAAALIGLVLLLCGSPQQALATEEESHVEAPLSLSESMLAPLRYFEKGSGVEQMPKVYLIFWGSNFEKEEGGKTAGKEIYEMLLTFFKGLTGSAYEGILTQYFDSTGGPIGRVSSTVELEDSEKPYIVNNVKAPSSLNFTKITEEVERVISANKWASDINTQFVLVTPPGTTYEEIIGCAFHSWTSSDAVYDFVPYQGEEPLKKNCLALGNKGENAVVKSSKSASHEFAEAATDPYADTWGRYNEHEIADLCTEEEDFELADHAWAQELYDDAEDKCSKDDLKPPHVYTITESARSVTSTNATLEGLVDGEAEKPETHYYFEIGPTESYGTRTSEVGVGTGTNIVEAKQTVCGLAPSTLYYFRVAATNSTGTNHGKNETFTTAASGGSNCPSAITEAASNVKTIEATLNGTVNPGGLATKYHFEYGTTTSYGKTTSETSAGSGTSNIKESQTVIGLTGGTEYHVRVVATNSTGTTYGADKTFKTSTTHPPAVTTGSVTGITEAEATLHGTVDPEGTETRYHFSYGTEKERLTLATVEASAGAGTEKAEVSKVVKSLSANATYYYEISATNAGGTVYGTEKTFATSGKPTVETKPATKVGETTSTLNGAVNPKGAEAKYYFEYGTEKEKYTKKTAERSAGSGTAGVEETEEVTNLLRNTTYYFRIVATNVNGTTDGTERELTTLSSVITDSAAGVTATEAIVHGTVNPHGLTTTYQFEYGPTTSYGTTVPATAENTGSGTTVLAKGYILTGLTPSTTYHFRLVGKSSEGATYGKDATFTTAALTTLFASAFGSYGTGNGQFNEPTGIAIETASNTVVVSDEKNNRVEEFNNAGEFVRSFGTEGTGNGQFKEPRGIAVGTNRGLFVTDTGNNRVEEFTEKGEYENQFGTTGAGNGQFNSPKGVAVDPKGNIWVADSGNNRVEEFDSKREYVRQFSTGTNPVGIAVDSKGNVWNDNEDETGAIEEHNEKGELLQKFATRGEGEGNVLYPKRLAINSSGDVWVADAGNNRVEVFNEKGEYVTTFGGTGSGSEQMKYPTGVALDSNGNVWVADDENNRVDKWRTSGVQPPLFSNAFGSLGTGNSQFDEPPDVAVSAINGTLVVSDEKNDRVEEFNEEGKFVRAFGSEGTEKGRFKEPRGVAVGTNGALFVADTGNNRVEEFTEKGEYENQFGSEGTEKGKFKEPRGVAVDPKGNIWVADSGNNRVEEFNSKREYVRQFSTGTNPVGIAVDSKGNVWNDNEGETGVIEEHNEKGEFLQKFATRGEGYGQVKEPRGLAIDSAGDVWVSDSGNSRVEVFNEKGEVLRIFGAYGTGSEQMEHPSGVAVDHSGNVWIADYGNDRVDRWER